MTTLTDPAVAAPTDRRADWIAAAEALAAERADEPEALAAARRRARESLAAEGFPTRDQEAWRKTDVRPVSQSAFAPASGPQPVAAAELRRHLFDAVRLAFVDGHLAPDLCALDGLPDGVRLESLAASLGADPERVTAELGRHAAVDGHPFVALNTALFRDGAYVEVPRGTVLERPLHLLFVSTTAAAGEPRASFPRNLVVAREASRFEVVETYVGAADGVYLTCPVTEVVVAPHAVVDHYKVQHESHAAFHLATLQLLQARASSFFSHSVSTGGAITRNDVNGVLDGEGCECTLNGLYLAEGEQLVDNHMRVDHVRPHCNSYELYKGILDGRSRAVFNGLIHVHEGAQKTDAKQSNRNLLLSRGALASSNPQLEIFADDVKCTHGSTVGQLDEDAVFYLRSRGIGEEAAKSLLTYAFASDIVSRIKVEPVRRDLEELLFARLPQGDVVRQAV